MNYRLKTLLPNVSTLCIINININNECKKYLQYIKELFLSENKINSIKCSRKS